MWHVGRDDYGEAWLYDYMGLPIAPNDIDLMALQDALNHYTHMTEDEYSSHQKHCVALHHPHMYEQMYHEPLPEIYADYHAAFDAYRKSQTKSSAPSGPGKVYLLKSHGIYKIGMTRNSVAARVNQIQQGMPYPVEILHVIHTNRPEELEAELHNRYEHARLNGEWFDLIDKAVDYIMSLEDET